MIAAMHFLRYFPNIMCSFNLHVKSRKNAFHVCVLPFHTFIV